MKRRKVMLVIVIIVGVLLLLWVIVPGKFADILETKMPLEEIQRIEIEKVTGPYALAEDTIEITNSEHIAGIYQELQDVSVLRWISQDSHSAAGEKKPYHILIEGEEATAYITFWPSSFSWHYLIMDNKEYICWQ